MTIVKKTVMIIDDSLDVLLLHKAILEMEGYNVIPTANASRGLAALKAHAPPDLIILDMRMKEMSGLNFLLLVEKEFPKILKSVPIVFYSGIENLPECKASGLIPKGLDIDKFIRAVALHIEKGVSEIQKS